MFGGRRCGQAVGHASRGARAARARRRWCGAVRRAMAFTNSARVIWSGLLLGCAAFALAGVGIHQPRGTGRAAHSVELPRDITFLAPVQQAGNALTVEVANIEDETIGVRLDRLRRGRRCFALVAWAYAWLADKPAWHDRRLDAARVGGAALAEWRGPFFAVVAAFFASGISRCPRCAGSGNCRASRSPPPPPAAARLPLRRCGCSSALLRIPRCAGTRAGGSCSEEAARRRNRHAADSRRGKVRVRDGENSLAGGERPAAAAAVRAGRAHEDHLSRRGAEARAGRRRRTARAAICSRSKAARSTSSCSIRCP